MTADGGANVLVDTPPEMRLAFLANHVRRLDAILYTHSHADHVFGLDDVRTFNYKTGAAMPLYAEPNVLDDLRRIYNYVFKETPVGGGKPQVDLHETGPGQALELLWSGRSCPCASATGVCPFSPTSSGLRFAYVTDVSYIPPGDLAAFGGPGPADAGRRPPRTA